MPKEKKQRFYWKGKLVTEKVYKARLNQQEAGRNVRSIYGTKNSQRQLNLKKKEAVSSVSGYIDLKEEGCKIFDVETIAHGLICKRCKNVLSLLDTTDSIASGLGTTYYVKCRKCEHINDVLTDKQHSAPESQRMIFNCNTKAVIGTLNGGGGLTTLNKILTTLGVSPLNCGTYKTHEKEVSRCIEKMVEGSCMNATKEERQLTIENSEKLKKLLPDHLQENFLFPDLSTGYEEKDKISSENIVRVGGSFDMGWPTKGSGRSYDSLSGTAGLIGYFSRKVISQVVLNRKCRMCNVGHPKSDHDCKLNFVGSAKAMEPRAAELLVGESNKILSTVKVQLGIFIGDCDSNAILAARNAVNYEIVKHDDLNHTSKGVTSQLYKKIKSHKELNSKSIKYLGKCFNYCVTQNKGDKLAMATAIENIPYHCFNRHENCGTKWCQYSKNPDSYKHAVIGEGFTDPELFNLLKTIFGGIAKKASGFSGGVSSNPNESFNATVASKAPKSRLYGTSQSYNTRVGLAVLKKNEGEKFIVQLLENCQVSPIKNLAEFCNKVDKYSSRRYDKVRTTICKRRRLFL
ncbi:uncharacterized protein [Venturia canescens]|uniref:uncharacterized protein n=1 Tax=Venturia canescens TaxID=32260 RepID=UPI001C9BC108|nr:uncharacterized protein LOC122413235 [Venturia canescens]